MRKLILLIFLVLFFGNAFSQNKITGIIIGDSSKPLSFASAYLSNDSSNSNMPRGALSNDSGRFELYPVQSGSYTLTVRRIGYKDSKQHISVNADIDLNTISLIADSTALYDVVVKSTVPLISRKADRYILNVEESVLTKGRNTFDILNYAPGVMTMGDGIAINGNTATKIMVNGRLLNLNADQIHNYLSNLQADEVQSIEIIPVPGAEFDAAGGGGIINIKLKKNRSSGLSGSVGVGIKTPKLPTYNTNEELNYGYKGLQLYASHNYNHNNSYGDYGDNRMSGTETYSSSSHAVYNSHANNYRLGAGYNFNEKHFLGIEFNGNNNASNGTTNTNSIYNQHQNSQENINSIVGNQSKNGLYSLSLNYNWNIDSLGSAYKLMSDYTWANYNQNGNYHSQYNDSTGNFLFDSIYRNQVPLNIHNYDVSVDYTKHWLHAGSLSFGGKYTHTHPLNNVIYQNFYNQEYIYDSTRSNVFDYTENVGALYVQYAKDWKTTSIQLGLRGEQTHTVGISPSTDTSFKRNYFNLFPSAFIKHDFSSNHTLSLSYSRRLDRPSFEILNPFELRTDDYTFIKGNPALNPQYTHDIELSYLFHKKYELTFFTQLTSAPFGQPLTNGGGTSIVSEYLWINMKSEKSYGATFYLPITITKWWTTINNLQSYSDKIIYSGGNTNQTVFYGKTTQDFTVKKWRFELSGFYQSSYNIGNMVFVPKYSIDLGLHKSFWNDKLNTNLLVTDIFNMSNMGYKVVTSSITDIARQKYLTRRFSFQLTYNFSAGKKVKMTKVEAGNADEKNRM